MNCTRAVIDIETTGLKPDKSVILEIGVILVDQDYRELNRFHRVIFQNAYDLEKCSPEVVEMHTKNGLLKEVKMSPHTQVEVQASLVAFIKEHCEVGQVQMMGNSITFDKTFIQYHMPQVANLFHYRVRDLRSVQTFLEDCGEVFAKEVSDHRSMPDCEMAIARALEMRTRWGNRHG